MEVCAVASEAIQWGRFASVIPHHGYHIPSLHHARMKNTHAAIGGDWCLQGTQSYVSIPSIVALARGGGAPSQLGERRFLIGLDIQPRPLLVYAATPLTGTMPRRKRRHEPWHFPMGWEDAQGAWMKPYTRQIRLPFRFTAVLAVWGRHVWGPCRVSSWNVPAGRGQTTPGSPSFLELTATSIGM